MPCATLEYPFTPISTISLAVYNAHATQITSYRFMQELQQELACGFAAQAVQV